MLLKPISRDTLAQQARDTLKRFIIQANLQAGDPLPSEHELSENLAVSRHIVREALSALAVEGIVVKRAGKGSYVREFDRSQVAATLQAPASSNGATLGELLEFRVSLEMSALELIVRRITQEEIETLDQIANQIEQKYRQGKVTNKEDIAFHLTLLQATKNSIFMEMAPIITEFFRREIVEAPELIYRSAIESTIVQHHTMVEALRQRDLATAQQAMRDHLVLLISHEPQA